MAAKKKAKAPKVPKEAAEKKPKAAKANRKETRESPGAGHNLASLRAQGADFVERFINLSDAMASDMAGYRSDFKNLYEEAANDLGLKKSVITKELKRILANKKAAEAEKDMPADERQQQFEMFAAGDLAPAPEVVGDETSEDHLEK